MQEKNLEQQTVIRPEPHVFADYHDEEFLQTTESAPENTALRKVARQGTIVYLTQSVKYPDSGGMLMKYKDVPYLRQGFVFPEAMNNINNMKRITVLFLAFLKGKGIKGRIGAVLAHYCWVADWMFQWYDPSTKSVRGIYLKENRYRRSVRELIKLINNFLDYLGIKVEGANVSKQDFGRVIGTMIEFDNAYYSRMEDIFGEINKESLLKNPIKELTRVYETYKLREKGHIEFKFESIIKILRYAFWFPGVKKAFRKAIESIDLEKMKMTTGGKGEINDTYFSMKYEGYDFLGKTIQERQKIWLEMTDGIPPERIVIPPQ
jgi:hypothetical protein